MVLILSAILMFVLVFVCDGNFVDHSKAAKLLAVVALIFLGSVGFMVRDVLISKQAQAKDESGNSTISTTETYDVLKYDFTEGLGMLVYVKGEGVSVKKYLLLEKTDIVNYISEGKSTLEIK